MKRWMVLRTDTLPNTFIVEEDIEREEDADRLVTEMTARGHHQFYEKVGYLPEERETLLQERNIIV